MRANALPPYTGRDAVCVKCGWKGAATRHLQYGDCVHGGLMVETVGFGENERLHRECDNCGYMWDEAVVEFDRSGIPK